MKTKQLNKIVTGLAAALVLIGGRSTAHAAILVTKDFNNTSQIYYPAIATDLINSGQPTLAGVSSNNYVKWGGLGSLANLNNGTVGASGNTGDLTIDDDGVFTVTFDLTIDGTRPLGYSITSIQTFAGWDDARIQQAYEVWYSQVGSASYVQLGGAVTNRVDGSNPVNGSTRITIAEDTLPYLVTGVDSLQFRFSDATPPLPSDNMTTAYREVDVLGVATIPEPATMLLLLCGGGLVALRRRR